MAIQRQVGQSLLRAEDDALLRGEAQFVADLDPGAAMAHVVFVRATVAHGNLVSIETAAAKAAPGVIAVVSAADHNVVPARAFNEVYDVIFAQPLLAEHKVRYVGEPIVAVIAETPARAADAAELVEVDYEVLDAVMSLDHAASGETLLFTPADQARTQQQAAEGEVWSGGNQVGAVYPDAGTVAQVDAAFAAADVRVALDVFNPRQSPAPIEARVMTCEWRNGELYVWAPTQVPHSNRNTYCELYGLTSEQVHVVAGPSVGGGFGGKTARSPEERVLPLLSQIAGRPVSWVESRSEYMAAATQSRGEEFAIELAGSNHGRIEALRVVMRKDCGAYPGVGARVPEPYTIPMAGGPYDIAAIEFTLELLVTNAVQVGAFRGAGRAPMIDALERAVDVYAKEIGMDPAAVRRHNLIRPEQMPYITPGGASYDEADYPGDLDKALLLAGYNDRRSEQAARRAAGGDRQLGIGIGCYLHLTGGPGGEEVSVTIADDGSATIVTGSTTQGHGHVTTWAQIASDVLGIDLDAITVVEGDTDAIGTGGGAVGSRSAQTAGVAIHRASETLVERGRQTAAELLEAAVGDVVLDVESASFHVQGTPAIQVGWADVAAAGLAAGDPFTCGDHFDPGEGVVPSGTHIAVVEVDTETGSVDVIDFVAVDDAGVRINPMIVDGQIHGGIAAGIGQVLGEAVIYNDAGNLLTSNFADYPIVSIDQLPMFRLEASAVATSRNPLGVKAIGESGPVGAAAALHNAIVDAVSHLGVRHIELPCTSERIWEALQP